MELLAITQAALARRIAEEQAARRAPSLVAAVVRDGELVWDGARGRVDGAVPTLETQYRIGSITKTVVAVLVLRLRDEGSLDLSDRLDVHVADAPFGDRTVAQLLAHTGELREDPPGDWWERVPGGAWSDLVRTLGAEDTPPLRALPRYRYSNVGYALLGRLIEQKRSVGWYEAARDEVLEPLGMLRTSERPLAPHADGWSVHPWADVLMAEPAHDTGAMDAAGQLWGTTGDLCRLLAAIGGNAPAVLRPDTAAEMRVPTVIEDPDGWTTAYGLGVELRRPGGRALVGNFGSMPGFRAAAWLDVEAGVGAAVVANATAGAEPAAVAADLIELVARHEPHVSEWAPLADADPRLLALTGVWSWGARPQLVRLLAGGELAVGPQLDGAGATRFVPAGDGAWSGVEGPAAGATLRVETHADGRPSHLLLGSFILTRAPYDPPAPVPGGVDPAGWQGAAAPRTTTSRKAQMTHPLDVTPAPADDLHDILSADALAFVAELHARFGARRDELLAARAERDAELRRGGSLDFLPETRELRESEWTTAPARADYLDRRVEITGPTDRKMMINALNSGARGFMADCEDATSPTWENIVRGQLNLRDAAARTLTYDSSDGRHYELNDELVTMVVRPRGWHLPEKHVRAGGTPIAGALVDFGLFAFHSARLQLDNGSAPYLYLPKLEHHLEARLWNDVLVLAQEALGIPHGSFRATVLVETLPAAFQMDELLWELREHSYGLNAGRWDYIFSAIKCFRDRAEAVLPDRTDVRMTVPFMRAYTERLVQTCHRRGIFAMGGMAALIPSRRDEAANARALAAVHSDKRREASDGFDGTWVAHPDVVAAAREEFDAVLGGAPNQISRLRPEVAVDAARLLDFAATPGAVTEAGLRGNVRVGFLYLSNWLTGRGAAGIDNMMEDAATAEICRTQIWQWIRQGSALADGRVVTRELVDRLLDEETARIRGEVGDEVWERGRPRETRELFERVALADELPTFLTLPAYELLP